MVIAIDGPAGAGKSTVAKALAHELGFTYLDSGAMYRCIGLLALASPDEPPALIAKRAHFKLGRSILLDGQEVDDAIRSPEVTKAASVVAADPGVREALVSVQRELIAEGDWVVEGRDIGTVVAPDAGMKIFLTAATRARARRRALELGADQSEVLAEIEARDERDSERKHSPLVPAQDAVMLDTTDLTLEQVVARIVAMLPAR